MTPEEALYQGITGGPTLESEGRSVPDMVGELSRAFGTRPPAGMAPRTWRRYRHGEIPRNPTPRIRAALRAAQRRARLSADREQRLRRLPKSAITVQGMIMVSSDERHRVINLDGWDDDPRRPMTGVMGAVLPRWLAFDDSGAVRELTEAMGESIGASVHFGDMDFIELEAGEE